jgi:HPt (histidine-containing phosphotransfer) domain-containing protein
MIVTDRLQSAAPVELEELLARCVGNMDFVERVLGRFITCFGDDIHRLERCFRSQELEELARIAHAMKGAAANIAAHRLEDLIAEIEAIARVGQLDDFSSRLAQLRDEWSRVAESASAIRAGRGFETAVTISKSR